MSTNARYPRSTAAAPRLKIKGFPASESESQDENPYLSLQHGVPPQHPPQRPIFNGFGANDDYEEENEDEDRDNFVIPDDERDIQGPCKPWVPRLKSFTVIVRCTVDANGIPEDEVVINHEALFDVWAKDRNYASLQNLRFENTIVKTVAIKNKSTGSDFNATVTVHDAKGQPLYNAIPCFGGHIQDVSGKGKHAQTPCGTPLWGDQTGVRIVYKNSSMPTKDHMAYANFDPESLKANVKHLDYEVPNKDFGKRNAKNPHERTIKMKLTHVPKNPCAPFFEWALAKQNQVYAPGFTQSPQHSVAGMPNMFCINTDDYKRYVSKHFIHILFPSPPSPLPVHTFPFQGPSRHTFIFPHLPFLLLDMHSLCLSPTHPEIFTHPTPPRPPRSLYFLTLFIDRVVEAFEEKRKTIGTHDLTEIKFSLVAPEDPNSAVGTSNAPLPPGVHCFQLDFEVWMASKDERREVENDGNSDAESDDDDDVE